MEAKQLKQLIEECKKGDQKSNDFLFDCLDFFLYEAERTIFKMYYGICCYPKPSEEIADVLGYEKDEIDTIVQYTTKKIEQIIEFYRPGEEQRNPPCLRIKDLDFDEAKKMPKSDSYMLVTDWLDMVQKSQKVNKPYQALLDRIKQDMPDLLITPAKDPLEPWRETLEKTPTGKLAYFLNYKEAPICEKSMPEHGIKTLWDLHKWKPLDKGRKRYIEQFKVIKLKLEQECPEILERIKRIEEVIELPIYYDENNSLYENIKLALNELAEFLKNKVENNSLSGLKKINLSKTLYAHIVEGLQWDTIAEKLNRGEGYLKDLEREFIDYMLQGNIFEQKIKFLPEITDKYICFEENCLFESEDKMIQFTGGNEKELLDILGYELLDMNGIVKFVIPSRNKSTYQKVWKSIIASLKKNAIVPIDKSEIIDMIEDDLESLNLTYDIKFINNVIKCEEIVDVLPNDMIQLADNLLNDAQRIARILYNISPAQIERDKLEALFEQQYHRAPKFVTPMLSDVGVYCTGMKWYYGSPMEPIKNMIEKFALERKHFYYNDLEQYLIKEKYTIPKSIRTKITTICQADTKDSMHFCHKDFVKDYPEYTWRVMQHTGLENWILNQINEMLQGRNSVSVSEIVDEIEIRSHNTEYENRIRERVRSVLARYTGDGQPFINDKDVIKINPDSYGSVDFDIIGRRGNFPFCTQIRSLLSYEIKKTSDGKMLLTDAVTLAQDSLGADNVHRNIVLRALENKYLTPIDIVVKTENGRIYIVWTKTDVKPEPTYQVVASQTNQDREEVQKVVDTTPRRSIKYRDEIDWVKLSDRLKSELSFYKFWMSHEGLNFDKSVDLFLAFIKQSTNSNLSVTLPQNLYEYCFASTDAYDRENYVRNLSLFFEALLADIYYRKNHKKLSKKGLFDWADEFDLAHKLIFSSNSKGFDRLISNLYHMRNKLAHGDAVELNSRDTASTIADDIALYIYICAKFVE